MLITAIHFIRIFFNLESLKRQHNRTHYDITILKETILQGPFVVTFHNPFDLVELRGWNCAAR